MAERGTVLSLTDGYRYTDYGEPIVALKSFIFSPFVEETHIETVVTKILEARDRIPFLRAVLVFETISGKMVTHGLGMEAGQWSKVGWRLDSGNVLTGEWMGR